MAGNFPENLEVIQLEETIKAEGIPIYVKKSVKSLVIVKMAPIWRSNGHNFWCSEKSEGFFVSLMEISLWGKTGE